MNSADRNIIAVARCKPRSESPVVVVGCKRLITVTYTFTVVSQRKSLTLPYAVVVNHQVHAAYANAPKKLKLVGADNAPLKGSITIPVEFGDTVALYLGSDASVDWRSTPLYQVAVEDRLVVVNIQEKMGLHAHADTPVHRTGSAADTDEYDAVLTGMVWMRMSHRYRVAEVAQRLPAGTAPQVAQAIESIYRGLSQGMLTITVPAKTEDGPQVQGAQSTANTTSAPRTRSVTLHFPVPASEAEKKQDNCYSNIPGFDLLSDGITRVHPAGYAALVNAALDNGVRSVRMNSCWRPMVGSITHRIGLGLDVGYLDTVRLNREALVSKDGKPPAGKADAQGNVSPEERAHYQAYESAKREAQVADAENERLKRVGTDDEKTAANTRLKNANELVRNTKEKWKLELEKDLPPLIKAFRKTLRDCTCISQVFDPWYMSGSKSQLEPNEMTTGNEKLHSHHLHITVQDTKILP